MDSSLSRVPPVWPRPRPEIIGTKPPQAAMIGASSRLTLSPTPPVECLSSTGPPRRAPRQSSSSPERVMAPVRATRSAPLIPRRKMAMARAPTCASLTLPSVIPATSCEISSGESSLPSRLRRISSATSMAQPREEGEQQAGELAGRPLGDGQRLLVAERLLAQALGEVGDHRHRGHPQPAVAGENRLLHGGHADGVGAEDAVGADLRRGLEARAADPEVDALGQSDAGARR